MTMTLLEIMRSASVIPVIAIDDPEHAVPLARVHFGFRCPPFGSAEFDALEVASQILAGGRGSQAIIASETSQIQKRI